MLTKQQLLMFYKVHWYVSKQCVLLLGFSKNVVFYVNLQIALYSLPCSMSWWRKHHLFVFWYLFDIYLFTDWLYFQIDFNLPSDKYLSPHIALWKFCRTSWARCKVFQTIWLVCKLVNKQTHHMFLWIIKKYMRQTWEKF